jgi:hypothetical protein
VRARIFGSVPWLRMAAGVAAVAALAVAVAYFLPARKLAPLDEPLKLRLEMRLGSDKI